MQIRDMFSSAISLLESESLIKDIYFPDKDVTVRASVKFMENLGNSARGSKAYNAKVLVELQELDGTGVDIKYDTLLEIDDTTWKIVQQDTKNEVFQSFFIRSDSRWGIK